MERAKPESQYATLQQYHVGKRRRRSRARGSIRVAGDEKNCLVLPSGAVGRLHSMTLSTSPLMMSTEAWLAGVPVVDLRTHVPSSHRACSWPTTRYRGRFASWHTTSSSAVSRWVTLGHIAYHCISVLHRGVKTHRLHA